MGKGAVLRNALVSVEGHWPLEVDRRFCKRSLKSAGDIQATTTRRTVSAVCENRFRKGRPSKRGAARQSFAFDTLERVDVRI